jgi:hypothetical protein
MSARRNHQESDDQQEPTDSTRKKPVRVIPGSETVAPSKRKPKIRVVGEDRLTPQELKQRFASNLDRLIGILGLTRKQASQEIGIPYKLVRRLASAGVSCTDERNIESLTRIVRYFALPSVEHLWRDDLLRLLLTTDEESGFVKKFRDLLVAERERRIAGARVMGQEEVTLIGRALGVLDADATLMSRTDAEKVATILASTKADTFRRIIDDYFALAKQPTLAPEAERVSSSPASRA